MKKINYSFLELTLVYDNDSASKTIERTRINAQYLDKLGYKRIWFTEHHNTNRFASSATSILISYISQVTNSIRVGSGGIMLPNHVPLIIAEQFGTLESINPGRIDLGLGRSFGTDRDTALLLRRNNLNTYHDFKNDVMTLMKYFNNDTLRPVVDAFPGRGLNIPIWILGCGTESAELAASLGLPYAYGAHLTFEKLNEAAAIYFKNFKPSESLKKPYFMVSINVIIADNNDEAKFLSNSLFNMMAGTLSGRKVPFTSPTIKPLYEGDDNIKQALSSTISSCFIGDVATVTKKINDLINNFMPHEIMVTNYIYDDKKRLKAFDLISDVFKNINKLRK